MCTCSAAITRFISTRRHPLAMLTRKKRNVVISIDKSFEKYLVYQLCGCRRRFPLSHGGTLRSAQTQTAHELFAKMKWKYLPRTYALRFVVQSIDSTLSMAALYAFECVCLAFEISHKFIDSLKIPISKSGHTFNLRLRLIFCFVFPLTPKFRSAQAERNTHCMTRA